MNHFPILFHLNKFTIVTTFSSCSVVRWPLNMHLLIKNQVLASRKIRSAISTSSFDIIGIFRLNGHDFVYFPYFVMLSCGDWNGHVGSTGSGYKEVHGGYGYGKPDPDSEGERILEYALAYDLFLGNTCFKKRDSHLITYRSGNTATKIDFMLFRKSLRKLVMDVKVIPGEEVALQHQLLVCDMMIDMPPQIKGKFTPRPKVWKLRDPQTCSRFQEVFKAHVSAVEAATTTEEIWAKLKTGLLKTTEELCGTTKAHRWRCETWWWNKEVDDAITAKRQAFKAWKAGKCTRAS